MITLLILSFLGCITFYKNARKEKKVNRELYNDYRSMYIVSLFLFTTVSYIYIVNIFTK